MFSAQFLTRYRVDGRLAEGGMGVLWRGTHLELQLPVAIKTLKPELAPDEKARERFLEEARLTARLTHPHIVRVLDCGRDDGILFIVYEFIEGEDLRARLQRDSALFPADFFRLSLGIAQAVEHAHGQGVIHRDLKPENVLLGRDGRILVSDFGLARCLEESAQRTATGAMLGTLSYLSPEVAMGQRAGPASDVYALGLMAYELLAGRQVFQASNAVALLRMHADQPAPPLSDARPDAPRPLATLLDRALAKKPAERPTAVEWRTGMQEMGEKLEWNSPLPAARKATPAGGDVHARATDRTVQRRPLAEEPVARKPRAKTPTPPEAKTPAPPLPPVRPSSTVSPAAAAFTAALLTLLLSAALFRSPPVPPPAVSPPPATAAPPPAAKAPTLPPEAVKPPPPPTEPPPAGRSLDRLRAYLSVPGAPDHNRVRLDSRAYTFTLGEPFGRIPADVDNKTREQEIRRLAELLTHAAAWQPAGGLEPLLTEAAKRLDDPAEPSTAKLEFLKALEPFLDLEAIVNMRGLSSQTPYFDFLYGKGKTTRRFYLLRVLTIAEMDELVKGQTIEEKPGARQKVVSWQQYEESSMQAVGALGPGGPWSAWFHKYLGSDDLPRLLATECTIPSVPADFSQLAEGPGRGVDRTPHQYGEDTEPGPLSLEFGTRWQPHPNGRAELWARTISLLKTFRLDVKLAGWIDVGFRIHPEVWNQQTPPPGLAFSFPAIPLDVSKERVPAQAELHLVAGEDVFIAKAKPETVSMSQVAFVLRQFPPAK